MTKYVVTVTQDGMDAVCGSYNTLSEAKNHLTSIVYYTEYTRYPKSLDISDDGMTGYGKDADGAFIYKINVVEV